MRRKWKGFSPPKRRLSEKESFRRLTASSLVSFCIFFLGLTGCQMGTPTADLEISPDQVDYSLSTCDWLRTEFQVFSTDAGAEERTSVDHFPVEVFMVFADGQCGSSTFGQYFVIEDVDFKPVGCPWKTETGYDGNLRFFIRFLGSDTPLSAHYTVEVFGKEGAYTSARVDLCCSTACAAE